MIATRRALLFQNTVCSVPVTLTRAGVGYTDLGAEIPANAPRYNVQGYPPIEEAATNVLPASQSLSLAEAYTTGTLNGTYTFSCTSGSITLGGGASGTVTPTNPVTATISSATVTLTPTGTPTLNQVENKAYPTTFQLGGTNRNAELLTIPTTTLNLPEMTVMVEILLTNAFINNSVIRALFYHWDGTNNRINIYKDTLGRIFVGTTNNAGENKAGPTLAPALTKGTVLRVIGSYKSTSQELSINNAGAITHATSIANPYIPTVKGTCAIGSRPDTTLHSDAPISKVIIWKRYMAQAERESVLTAPPTKVTRDITFLANWQNTIAAKGGCRV